MTSGLTETLLAPSDDTTQCHSLAAQLAKGLCPGLSIDTLSLFCRGEPCCPLQLEFNVDGELVWLVEPAATPQDNTDYFPLAGMGSSKALRTNEVAGRTTMGLFLLCDRVTGATGVSSFASIGPSNLVYVFCSDIDCMGISRDGFARGGRRDHNVGPLMASMAMTVRQPSSTSG